MEQSKIILFLLAVLQLKLNSASVYNFQRIQPKRLLAYRIPEIEESTDATPQEPEESQESTSAAASFPTIAAASPTCAGRDFNITVTGKRCASKVVKSKFCYGLCSSFYVPGRRGSPAQMSECCKPTETVIETVELECMKKGNKGMKIKKVDVERVISCGCQRSE